MKMGDLVTLSAYGARLVYVSRCLSRRRMKNDETPERPLVGLVTSVKMPEQARPWETQNQYKIQWIGEENPIKGREDYTRYFNRKDLKMVSKA